jgi:hypothetical protein
MLAESVGEKKGSAYYAVAVAALPFQFKLLPLVIRTFYRDL